MDYPSTDKSEGSAALAIYVASALKDVRSSIADSSHLRLDQTLPTFEHLDYAERLRNIYYQFEIILTDNELNLVEFLHSNLSQYGKACFNIASGSLSKSELNWPEPLERLHIALNKANMTLNSPQ